MSNIRLFALALILLIPDLSFANQAASGFCTTGGIKVTTFGSLSSNPVQGSYLGCSVTVSIHGGGLATITDANGGALANPFTASSTNGFWQFAAANGFYDVTLSGGNPALPAPVTIVNLLLNDPNTASITQSSFTGSGFISSTALVAGSGIFRCASVDNCLVFRNIANGLDLALKKTGAAAGNLPADVLDASAFGGIKVSQFFSNSAQSAATGVLACSASDTCVSFRNQANSADIPGLAHDASDRIVIGGAAGFTASIGNITNGLTIGTTLTVGGASSLQGVTATTITASGEIAPSVTGGALGDTAHRFDAFIRNLDVISLIIGSMTVSGNVSVGGTLGAKCVNGVCDLVGAGAKCDGATDDRVTIQALLSTAGVKTITAPPGLVCLIGSNPGAGVLLTDPGVSIQGVSFKVGNSIGNYNAFIDVTGSPNGISFTGNTFDGNATNNVVNSDPLAANNHISVRIFGGSNITIQNNIVKNNNDVQTFTLNPCDNCKVIGNTWTNAGVGGTFDHDSSEVYLTSSAAGIGGEVTDNIMTAAGLGVRTAIEVHKDSKTVANNVIQKYRYCIITSAELAVAHDFNIIGNTCNAVYRGVYIWGVDGQTDGITVTGNEININRNGFWSVVNDEAGIGTNATNTFDLINAKISGNTIRWTADVLTTNNASAGIAIVSTAGNFNPTKIEISGNHIDNVLCAAILVEPLGLTWTSITIKNNDIINPGQRTAGTACANTAFQTGISMVGAGAGFVIKDSIVEGNHIADTQASPTMQIGFHWFGVAGDGASGGGTVTPALLVRNNSVTYFGTPAQATPYFVFSTTSPEYHETVPSFTRASPIDSGEASPNFPPKGSSIYDPISGRTYVQTVLATGRAFQSFENTQSIPAAGAYSAGDIAWNQLGSTNGTCAWYNVVSGSPGSFTSIPCNLTGSKVFVATDFTTANNTNLQAITGLSWTFPAVAANYSFHCSLLYSQATAAVADQFGIQAATNAPTNIMADAKAYISTSAVTVGNLPTLSTTTATPFVTFTPSATTSVFVADLDGTLELAASVNTVNIMVQTSAGADAVTVKRGSYCQLF